MDADKRSGEVEDRLKKLENRVKTIEEGHEYDHHYSFRANKREVFRDEKGNIKGFGEPVPLEKAKRNP